MTIEEVDQELAHVILDDSWVFNIEIDAYTVGVLVQFSLSTDDPRYSPPRPGEWGSYAKALLTWSKFTAVHWTGAEGRVNTDLDGSTDFGTIDGLQLAATSVIEGDFGTLRIEGASCALEWLPE